MTDADVVVIGGGSTGAGVARDLAMRGVDVTLVEKGTLTHGTTGRMHGLLHSGGRYAVSDRESARDCVAENRVLRDIAAHCVEETGGLFAKLPGDTEDYFEDKLEGCRACDIPVEVLSGEEARAMEPYLSDDVEKAIRVPDAAVDPFRLVVANAVAAEERGTRVETHAEVTDLLLDGDRVTGVRVQHGEGPARKDAAAGTTEEIRADHVVNATGAWAGQLAGMAGIDVRVRPSKGVMVVTNCRQVDTVVNRCAPKGDADIVVPHETTAILGTTDAEVDDPDDYVEEQWEVDLVVDELAKLVPILRESRTLRSYWGVRPLYEPPDVGTEDPTDITRDFFLLDHAARDGVPGLTSVVGGKFATYRRMAEEVSDHVCAMIGVRTGCRTDEVALPGSEDPGRLDDAMDDFGLRSPVARRSTQRLGSRASDVLDAEPNPVLCECEAVTRAEISDAIDRVGADLNAVRIRTRASMGNCQGGICCHRMAAELHPDNDEPTAYEALDELYQERWKGQRHALWGEQLSQAMLNHALHATTMNRDRDPAGSDEALDYGAFDAGPTDREDDAEGGSYVAIESDVIVIGRGIAGMTAGIAAARAGADVRVLAGKESTLRQASGLVDVLGYRPESAPSGAANRADDQPPEGRTGDRALRGGSAGSEASLGRAEFVEPLADPFDALSNLPDEHPYDIVGEDGIRAGLDLFDDAVGEAYCGNHTDRNALVPTHGGTVKPTARYPRTTAAGLASDGRDALLVGFETVPDFDPELAAAHLERAGVPFEAVGVTVGFPGDFRQDAKLTRYARALDEDEPLRIDGRTLPAREALTEAVKVAFEAVDREAVERVGFPALLGLDRPDEVRTDLESALGAAVFEVSMGPPSLPGMRLESLLEDALLSAGATLTVGNKVVDFDGADRRIEQVYVDRNGARIPYRAEEYVLATGGLVGKGIASDREEVREPVFGCHVPQPGDRYDWFVDEAFGDHPFARFGVRVDDGLRPLDADGDPEFANLRAAGAVLGGYDFAAEKSGAGVSLSTGRRAGERAAEEAR